MFHVAWLPKVNVAHFMPNRDWFPAVNNQTKKENNRFYTRHPILVDKNQEFRIHSNMQITTTTTTNINKDHESIPKVDFLSGVLYNNLSLLRTQSPPLMPVSGSKTSLVLFKSTTFLSPCIEHQTTCKKTGCKRWQLFDTKITKEWELKSKTNIKFIKKMKKISLLQEKRKEKTISRWRAHLHNYLQLSTNYQQAICDSETRQKACRAETAREKSPHANPKTNKNQLSSIFFCNKGNHSNIKKTKGN